MLTCKFCYKECKSKPSLLAHQATCPSNQNRKIPDRTWSEKRKKEFSIKCIETGCNKSVWTDERRNARSDLTKEFNNHYWTTETKLQHSDTMLQIVRDNPDSYSKNNVSGRVKIYEIISTTGVTKVKGRWELRVAEFLNTNKIRWSNAIVPFDYYWNNKWHLYFPDFYLIDYDVYIEVKGYKTDRDLAKWQSVNRELLIIDKYNIDSLEKYFAGKVVTTPVS